MDVHIEMHNHARLIRLGKPCLLIVNSTLSVQVRIVRESLILDFRVCPILLKDFNGN